jgi:predicted Zn finger-like uncharacterized protein
MKISCQSCGALYKIADDKVRGRRVKVRCKGCGQTIVVDAAQPEATDSPQSAAGSANNGAGSVDTWTVNLSETDQRTLTTTEILGGYVAGWLTSDAYVWKDGMADWSPLLDVPELRDALGPQPQPAPAAPPAAAFGAPSAGGFPNVERTPAAKPVAARRAGGRTQGAADLFGGVAAAGGEEEARSPFAGTEPYDDAKLTGARNENSVLFSLDALKAGFAGPSAAAPAPKGRPAPRAQAAASNPDDPFGMGTADAFTGIGGPNALFSMGANQALLTAPAPPPEPPPAPATDPALGQSSSILPPVRRRSRLSQVVMAAAAALALLVGGIVFAGLADDKEEAQAEQAQQAEEEAKKEEAEAKARAEKAKAEEEAKKAQEAQKKDEETAAADKQEATGKPATVAAAQAKATPAAQKPKAGGATKAAVKPDDTTKVKATPSDGVATFNKGAAIAALSRASAAASGCKRPGGPTGSGKAIVTFAPSGRVTNATISGGSFGGTSVGGCIASVFRRASVPSFSGNAVTVSKGFNISP